MTTAVLELLRSFESLADSDKRELAAEILRRSVDFEYLPLSDEDLVRNAEDLFVELDRGESRDAKTDTR